jgi:hypothetical protein
MAFEVYTPRSRSKEKEPDTSIKISKNSIVLNKNVRGLIQQPEYVELAFDCETSTIRIRPVAKGDGKDIQLKKTKVYAKGFLEHFQINNYGKHLADYNQEENAIFVTL